MPRARSEDKITDSRARVFADWVNSTGRKVGWVAQELGRSKVWISNVLNGHVGISDKLAEDIERRFGIDMGMRHGGVVPPPVDYETVRKHRDNDMGPID